MTAVAAEEAGALCCPLRRRLGDPPVTTSRARSARGTRPYQKLRRRMGHRPPCHRIVLVAHQEYSSSETGPREPFYVLGKSPRPFSSPAQHGRDRPSHGRDRGDESRLWRPPQALGGGGRWQNRRREVQGRGMHYGDRLRVVADGEDDGTE